MRPGTATVLIALAAALATSAIVAGSTPGSQENFQCSWNPDDNTKQQVKAAFETALSRSIEKKEWRKRLVASAQSAKNAILSILTEKKQKVVIPADATFVFYEPATDKSGKKQRTTSSDYSKSQCAHVFDLPDYTGKPAEKRQESDSLYVAHLQCCYDPW